MLNGFVLIPALGLVCLFCLCTASSNYAASLNVPSNTQSASIEFFKVDQLGYMQEDGTLERSWHSSAKCKLAFFFFLSRKSPPDVPGTLLSLQRGGF